MRLGNNCNFKNHVDTERLMTDVNALSVAEYIGLNPQKRGGCYFITCPNPDHTERHHDNCIITRNNRGYKCFSCEMSGDIIDMVGKHTGANSFYECLEIIASTVGGIDQYIEQSTERKNQNITYQDLKFLGLKSSVVARDIAPDLKSERDEEHQTKIYFDDENYGFARIVQSHFSFFEEESWKYIVRGKAQEKIMEATRLLTKGLVETKEEKDALYLVISKAKGIMLKIAA